MRALSIACVTILGFGACSSDDAIDSNEQARRAYLGLDASIEKSLALGFAGFNAATSANIAPQVGAGTTAGTLTITGQVDQGNSANKGLRLYVGMVAYTDGLVVVGEADEGVDLTYDTSTDPMMQPFLAIMLKGIPTGTLDGTLLGTYHLTGDITGDVLLDLTFSGRLQDAGGGKTIRQPGTTTVTGTATQGDGAYEVMLTL